MQPEPAPAPGRPNLARFAILSIAAAIVTIALKLAAWHLTGSIGLLSDAIESGVNLFAAVLALLALNVAARPADEKHAYGHAKIEYFAAGIEGALILVAAGMIAWTAVGRLLDPVPIEHVGTGAAVSAAAAVVNLVVGVWLVRAGREHRSITLEADGKHLLTDVWTSIGVILGVATVALTGIERLDPIIALLVVVNIVVTGTALVRRSMGGLMDEALPAAQLDAITAELERLRDGGLDYHALRTRTSGHRSFMSVHVLVPGTWTVQQGHDLVEQLEARLRELVPALTMVTHIEPIEDTASFTDAEIAD